MNASRRESCVTSLDLAGLASALAIRVRSTAAAVVMERGAQLKALVAIDDVEQSWRGDLALMSRRRHDGALYGLLEEMLSVDVLLRTWAALMSTSIDNSRQPLRTQQASGLFTRMLLQQRRRLLLTVINSSLDRPSLRELDKHRRLCERWNDVLLSVFPSTSSTRALQFDRENRPDLVELWPAPEVCQSRAADPVIVTALKSALPPIPLDGSPRQTAYAALATAVDAALQFDRRSLAVARPNHL
ncbi:MAG TPA: hypothetical protein VM452_09075 [Caulifigura sp.]|nr:hypothetical protein [Caulifigura sp.]